MTSFQSFGLSLTWAICLNTSAPYLRIVCTKCGYDDNWKPRSVSTISLDLTNKLKTDKTNLTEYINNNENTTLQDIENDVKYIVEPRYKREDLGKNHGIVSSLSRPSGEYIYCECRHKHVGKIKWEVFNCCVDQCRRAFIRNGWTPELYNQVHGNRRTSMDVNYDWFFKK